MHCKDSSRDLITNCFRDVLNTLIEKINYDVKDRRLYSYYRLTDKIGNRKLILKINFGILFNFIFYLERYRIFEKNREIIWKALKENIKEFTIFDFIVLKNLNHERRLNAIESVKSKSLKDFKGDILNEIEIL